MKKELFIIITLVLSISISSCKKDDKKNSTPAPAPTPAPTKQLYIKFTLDGVAKSFTDTHASVHTSFGGGGSSMSSGFEDKISINLSMPLDSIMGSDIQSLVGQKIPIGSCGGCPTNIYLDYEINGDNYKSYDSHNTLPSEYIKFNSVTYDQTMTWFDKQVKQYYVTGDFNIKLSYGSDVKNATNGTFGLIFRESKH